MVAQPGAVPLTETVDPSARAHVDGASDQLQVPAQLGDRYLLRELLGSGGFGRVYRAEDRVLRREVALKVLRPERAVAASMIRFRREVAVAREVSSPHLVRVFDIGSHGEFVFLTMELIVGSSLKESLAIGPLEVRQIVAVGRAVAEGLAALHERGILHRDVKPGNVLLGADGSIKLGDFGLVRRFEGEESQATVEDALIGTSEYISPEQALGQPLDQRSDLYSLGVLLFEAATGRLPFTASSSLGALLARLRMRPPRARLLRPDLPDWLDELIDKLLRPDPACRVDSAASVSSALENERRPARASAAGRGLARFLRTAALFPLLALASDHQFGVARIVGFPEDGIAAIAPNGRELWRRGGIDPHSAGRAFTLARLDARGPALTVGILHGKDDLRPSIVRLLSVLDGRSGRVLQRMTLPGPPPYFPSFAERYRPEKLEAQDFDGDGFDEIVVNYIQIPESPSYTVLLEPRVGRSRVVYASEGHQRLVGAADLDGDGNLELLFAGVNNPFGWYNALGAVRLLPGAGKLASRPAGSATSPDLSVRPILSGGLLWYTLLPRGTIPVDESVLRVDPAHRLLWVRYADGREIPVDFSGRVADRAYSGGRWSTDDKKAAFASLGEALRLLRSGYPAAAADEARRAITAAERVAEPLLVEAARRMEAKALARLGRQPEAQARFAALAQESENASEIAFDAAEACHLGGELECAVDWYLQGMGPGASEVAGKSKYEFLEGAVLALAELGDWRRAADVVERFEAAYRSPAASALYRAFIDWKRGAAVPALDRELRSSLHPPVTRYLALELALARGEPVPDLIRQVDEQLAEEPFSRGMLLSLKGELLVRLDRPIEATSALQQAVDLLAHQRRFHVEARASYSWAVERAARVSRPERSPG